MGSVQVKKALVWTVRGLGTIAALAILGIAVGLGALGVVWVQIGPLKLPPPSDVSPLALDRNGRLLRAFTTPDGRWRLGLAPADADPRYLAMLFVCEDKRFFTHGGVDPLAFLRAAWQFVETGRAVSGASTLTMQIARLLDGGRDRSGSGKVRQIVRALQIENVLNKDGILRLYLERAPFGGNIEGVRAATLAYFGKEPRHVTLGEAALLVALPQSPETRRPDRFPETARRARNRVLDRAATAGMISEAEAAHAKAEAIPTERQGVPMLAAHLTEAEAARNPDRRVHRLTLDRDLQWALETLVRERARFLGPKLSTAILVVEHATGEVRAYVGSAGYLDAGREGAIDMVQAVRSPGSTLKPIIYGLAFEAGLAHPETLIEDRPARFGTYRPNNFDEKFHGTVTVREALALSLNIPAVKVLEAVGPLKLVNRLEAAGIPTVLPRDAAPSLAIALGGVGVRLLDLSTLYVALARGGAPVALIWRQDGTHRVARTSVEVDSAEPPPLLSPPLLSPVAAWYVTDILKGAPPPPNAVRGRLAYKTGTSYGYRDAWAVGYDGRHTIGVWVGRPDGASVPGLLGRTTAAPILFDAFARIGGARVPFLPPPLSAIASRNGVSLPPPLRRFGREWETDIPGAYLEPAVSIAFPPDQSEMEYPGEGSPMLLKAEGGVLPLTWLADGTTLPSDPHRRDVLWIPGGRGFTKLSVVDAKGRVDRVVVRFK